MDRPASQLRLHFQTYPGLFEATTHFQFTVNAPPPDTRRQTVSFALKGDIPINTALAKEAIRESLSTQLDIDVSRITDTTIFWHEVS